MSTNKYVKALVSVILLIILVFILQLIVGVFGVGAAQVNYTLAALSLSSNAIPTISANAVNDVAANQLILTLAGSYSWISSSDPLRLTVTGNIINSYATNTVYAVPGVSNTQLFTITSATTPQTLCTGCGNFYNITALSSQGTASQVGSYPSITYTVTQQYLSAVHNSVPWSNTINTISANHVLTITFTGSAVTQFNQVGQSNTTIIPFVTVIVIVSLVVILLDLFGIGDILNLGGSSE